MALVLFVVAGMLLAVFMFLGVINSIKGLSQ
jgi:hypothetical protein